MPTKNSSVHVSALIAFAAAVVAYFHPGAHTGETAQTVISAVFAAGSVLLEAFHVQWKRDLLAGYNDLLMLERRLMATSRAMQVTSNATTANELVSEAATANATQPPATASTAPSGATVDAGPVAAQA